MPPMALPAPPAPPSSVFKVGAGSSLGSQHHHRRHAGRPHCPFSGPFAARQWACGVSAPEGRNCPPAPSEPSNWEGAATIGQEAAEPALRSCLSLRPPKPRTQRSQVRATLRTATAPTKDRSDRQASKAHRTGSCVEAGGRLSCAHPAGHAGKQISDFCLQPMRRRLIGHASVGAAVQSLGSNRLASLACALKRNVASVGRLESLGPPETAQLLTGSASRRSPCWQTGLDLFLQVGYNRAPFQHRVSTDDSYLCLPSRQQER